MANSRRLREANHHTIQQTDNDLAAQHAASDFALRKRIHEFERALDELNWQKKQVNNYLSTDKLLLLNLIMCMCIMYIWVICMYVCMYVWMRVCIYVINYYC